MTITASSATHDAIWAASEYFGDSIEEIDGKFGEGYAKEHPELIAAFMQTCAIDAGVTLIVQAIGQLES